MFVDPDDFTLNMASFSRNEKYGFIASDGANVNSVLKSGLITQFQGSGLHSVVFVWRLSHCLELALKDSLADALSDIYEVLTFLFYLYKKSSKNLRELRQLHVVLKDIYSFKVR